eukprot:g25986.t1
MTMQKLACRAAQVLEALGMFPFRLQLKATCATTSFQLQQNWLRQANQALEKPSATHFRNLPGPESMQMMQAALPTTDMVQSYSQNLLQSGTTSTQKPHHQSIPEASGERPSQGHAPQVWNPFPTQTTAIDPPVEQAWNPWASEGDGPFRPHPLISQLQGQFVSFRGFQFLGEHLILASAAFGSFGSFVASAQ